MPFGRTSSHHPDSDICYENIHEILEALEKNEYICYTSYTDQLRLFTKRDEYFRMLSIIQQTYPTAKVDIYEQTEDTCCCLRLCGGKNVSLTVYFYLPDTPQPWKRPKK